MSNLTFLSNKPDTIYHNVMWGLAREGSEFRMRTASGTKVGILLWVLCLGQHGRHLMAAIWMLWTRCGWGHVWSNWYFYDLLMTHKGVRWNNGIKKSYQPSCVHLTANFWSLFNVLTGACTQKQNVCVARKNFRGCSGGFVGRVVTLCKEFAFTAASDLLPPSASCCVSFPFSLSPSFPVQIFSCSVLKAHKKAQEIPRKKPKNSRTTLSSAKLSPPNEIVCFVFCHIFQHLLILWCLALCSKRFPVK